MSRRIGVLAAFFVVGAAHAAGVPGLGTWESTLQARDLDGDLTNGPEAFYDTALDLTWLRAVSTSGWEWDTAKSWAGQTRFGLSGWRLPTMAGASICNHQTTGGTDCGFNVRTKEGSTVYSELAHLFHVTLGNKSLYAPGTGDFQPDYGLANTGDFQGLLRDGYWASTEYALNSNWAWYFHFDTGYQYFKYSQGKPDMLYSLAVRDGDVAAVPEPTTSMLLVLGLGAIGALRRTTKAQLRKQG